MSPAPAPRNQTTAASELQDSSDMGESAGLSDDDHVEAWEFEVSTDSSVGDTLVHELSDSGWPNEALIASIIRGESVLMPDGSSKIEVGDHLLVVATRSCFKKVEEMCKRKTGFWGFL